MTVKLDRTWTCRRESANAACCCGVQEYRDWLTHLSQTSDSTRRCTSLMQTYWVVAFTHCWYAQQTQRVAWRPALANLSIDACCVALSRGSLARSVGRTMRGMAPGYQRHAADTLELDQQQQQQQPNRISDGRVATSTCCRVGTMNQL